MKSGVNVYKLKAAWTLNRSSLSNHKFLSSFLVLFLAYICLLYFSVLAVFEGSFLPLLYSLATSLLMSIYASMSSPLKAYKSGNASGLQVSRSRIMLRTLLNSLHRNFCLRMSLLSLFMEFMVSFSATWQACTILLQSLCFYLWVLISSWISLKPCVLMSFL